MHCSLLIGFFSLSDSIISLYNSWCNFITRLCNIHFTTVRYITAYITFSFRKMTKYVFFFFFLIFKYNSLSNKITFVGSLFLSSRDPSNNILSRVMSEVKVQMKNLQIINVSIEVYETGEKTLQNINERLLDMTRQKMLSEVSGSSVPEYTK